VETASNAQRGKPLVPLDKGVPCCNVLPSGMQLIVPSMPKQSAGRFGAAPVLNKFTYLAPSLSSERLAPFRPRTHQGSARWRGKLSGSTSITDAALRPTHSLLSVAIINLAWRQIARFGFAIPALSSYDAVLDTMQFNFSSGTAPS
jgi:hypothetical protein